MSHDQTVKVCTSCQMKASRAAMAKGDINFFRSSPSRVHAETALPTTSAGAADTWVPCGGYSSDENNSPTALNSFNWDKPSLGDKSVDFSAGCKQRDVFSAKPPKNSSPRKNDASADKRPLCNGYANLKSDSEGCDDETASTDADSKVKLPTKVEERLQKCGMPSAAFQVTGNTRDLSQATSSGREELTPSASCTTDGGSFASSPDSPPESLVERLAVRHRKEKEELRKMPWFQPDLPREDVQEALSDKPEGSFVVRESSTKPGCYALSLRVPEEKNPAGIAHYLVLHTNRGYKIKGFTKEFSSLHALITHHSVMPELLPCTLALPRLDNNKDHSRNDDDMDFVDTERRCSLFSDIHWLMTDLEL